jgi:phycocyanobilin lyase subunit beta
MISKSDPALAQTLIQAVEAADSATRLLEAVQDLAAAGLVETTSNLIAALNYNNPGAAVAAVDGLILIGKPAVQPLLELIDDYNYGARAWAIRALAGIGDPRSLAILLESAAHDFAMSVRRAATRGLGSLLWQDFPSEQVAIAQTQILTVLITVTQDPEWVVRYAAVTALQAIALAAHSTAPSLVPQAIAQLNQVIASDPDLTVRTRSQWALQQLLEAEIITSAEISANTSDNIIDNAIQTEWRMVIEQLYVRKLAQQSLAEGDPRRFRAVAAALAPKAPEALDLALSNLDYLSKVPVRGKRK